METNNIKKLKIGDWIKGMSSNGELILGYIETIDIYNTIVRVCVIESDNKKLKGRTIRVRENDIEKQSVISDFTEGELLNLIDLALSTRDKRWFFDLTAKLKRKQNTYILIKKKD